MCGSFRLVDLEETAHECVLSCGVCVLETGSGTFSFFPLNSNKSSDLTHSYEMFSNFLLWRPARHLVSGII